MTESQGKCSEKHARPTVDRMSRVHLAFWGCAPAGAARLVRYLNVKDDYLQELIERKPLALVK